MVLRFRFRVCSLRVESFGGLGSGDTKKETAPFSAQAGKGVEGGIHS